jgi:hypothetical protein
VRHPRTSFRETLEYGVGTGPTLVALHYGLIDYVRNPAARTRRGQMQNAPECRHQRIERAQIATQKPAHHDRIGAIDRQWSGLHDPLLKGDRQRPRVVALGEQLRLAVAGLNKEAPALPGLRFNSGNFLPRYRFW